MVWRNFTDYPVLASLKLIRPLCGELCFRPVLDGFRFGLSFLNQPLEGTRFLVILVNSCFD